MSDTNTGGPGDRPGGDRPFGGDRPGGDRPSFGGGGDRPPYGGGDRPSFGGGGDRPPYGGGGGGGRPYGGGGGGGSRSGPGGPGGPGGRRPGGAGGRGRDRYVPRRKVCAFCAEKLPYVDYKDVNRLRRFLSERGKIEPRRKTGTCARHQRALTVALKRARHVALLPFVAAPGR